MDSLRDYRHSRARERGHPKRRRRPDMGLTHELDFQAGPLALRAFPDHTHSDERRPWAVARSVLSSVNRWQNAARLWACTHFSGSPDILSARWAWLYGGLLAFISAV